MTEKSAEEYNCEKDFALIEEIFQGGYIRIHSVIDDCSERLRRLYKAENLVGLSEYREEIIQSGQIEPAVIQILQKSYGARCLYFTGLHDAIITNASIIEYPLAVILDVDISQCMPVHLNDGLCGGKKTPVRWTFLNAQTDKEAVNKIAAHEANIFVKWYEFKLTDKIYVSFIVDIFPKLNKRNKPINKSINEERQFVFSVVCDDIVLSR